MHIINIMLHMNKLYIKGLFGWGDENGGRIEKIQFYIMCVWLERWKILFVQIYYYNPITQYIKKLLSKISQKKILKK